jgi:hypothetical protein
MNFIKIILLSFILCFSAICESQAFTVIKATSQHWSGGVVGHWGNYYNIEIETSKRSIEPDSIWIINEGYPIDFSGKNGNCKRTFDSITYKIKYAISIAESHVSVGNQQPQAPDSTIKMHSPIMHFDGAALISYTYKHKRHYYIIKSFTTLKPKNYM